MVEESGQLFHTRPMPKNEPRLISYAGTFDRSMDAKNRVTVPADWLAGGPAEFHAIPHSSGDCLVVMPPEEFDSIATSIKQSGKSVDAQQKIIRKIYSKARAVSADSQGRILLPEDQCEALGLKENVKLVAVHSRFEIWNPKRWAEVFAEAEATYNEEASEFGL